MKATEILEKYLGFIWSAFEYDMTVFSEEMWMYYCCCIPAMAYLVFFCVKWVVIFLPVLMPVRVVLGLIFSKKEEHTEYRNKTQDKLDQIRKILYC